ncbi:MAG: hypothetical protein A2201_00650 [Alicyclobacillus sp. RIFOXYA1_FULL_53_8]|nr:MAG: hypothetical protein A2201_00650 [Alicyclobacillus sp. RIFOXYA1_FULL_53_8]
MKAVIMAGGKGTRLRPLTQGMPKPMLKLLHRPTLEYIVELLASHGITDIAMTLCYLPETIRNHFGDGNNFGVNIQYLEEQVPLGTAGGVKQMDWFLDDTFVVMSGDGVMDFDLGEAIAAHRQGRALATILLKRVECPKGYGVVEVDDDGRIAKFVEKPRTWIEGISYLINTGVYILEPEVFDFIPQAIAYDFGKDLFPSLLQLGVPLCGFEANGYWSDVGTLQQYYQTQLDMVHGHVKVNLPDELKVADFA